MTHYRNWNEFLTDRFNVKVGGRGIYRRGSYAINNKTVAALIKNDTDATGHPQLLTDDGQTYMVIVPIEIALDYIDSHADRFTIIKDAQYRPVTKVIERRQRINDYTSRIIKVEIIEHEPCATEMGDFSWIDVIDNEDGSATLVAEKV
jgi:hypothetical protein